MSIRSNLRGPLVAVTLLALLWTGAPAFAHGDGDGHEAETGGVEALKNAVSRAVVTPDAVDTTTPAQAAAGAAAVEAQRAEPDPELVPTSAAELRPHAVVPEDRYAMAGGCYTLRSGAGGGFVTGDSLRGFVARTADVAKAEKFWFAASDLGSYLLWDSRQHFVQNSVLGIIWSTKPGPSTDWVVTEAAGGFTFVNGAKGLGVSAAGSVVAVDKAKATVFTLRRASGCADWPEVDVNVTGAPVGGETAYQEVRGYLDGHTHGMAFEFLGGSVHCGRPWSPYGVAEALKDCPDHSLAQGSGAVLENFTRSGLPVGTHDPIGWPTFKDWPAPDSLTHEGTYWKWLERSWRGGQRLLVNLLVENNQLCTLYPLKRNSCDDMDAVRLQASDMRKLERFVDAQYGGPGRGWYRIVEDPFEARQVINSGRLAVVMGIETSVVFGCSTKLDKPTCTTDEIDRQLDEVHDLGVRQMELVNKFDNGLAGVAGDSGAVAPLVNLANFLETGSFWDMQRCAGTAGVQDNTQMTAVPDAVPSQVQDALFGAIAKLYIPTALPIYPSGPTCNRRGLTSLGEHTIEQMAAKKMLFDPDHMSVVARQDSLDVIERLEYPGVLSSHSWSTPDAYPRIYRAGGVITPYAGDSAGFVDKWSKHLGWADSRYYFGFGFGADINGLGAQGNPRGADAANPVTYPFTGLGGVRIDQQRSGQRVYDINVDGVAHYGLYPDWIEDLRRQAGDEIVEDMARGAEAYLQTWERAEGVAGDACRDSTQLTSAETISDLERGASVEDVLRAVGQPHERLGSTMTWCAEGDEGATVEVSATFDGDGGLVRVD